MSAAVPRWAWLVALVPLVAAVVAIVALGEAERAPSPTDALPAGLDSTAGAELRERLPEAEGSTAVVVYELSEDAAPLESLLAELQAHAEGLGAVPTGDRDSSGVLPAEDGTAALAIVPVDGGSATEVGEQVRQLRAAADRGLPSSVSTLVTGPAAVEADLAEVFEGADLRLLLATAAVVAFLLVITYRSPVLWLVPLLVVAVADRFAAVAATQVLDLTGTAWDESTVGILSVLVFGAGTDYALLLISRYRDELGRTTSRATAMGAALRRTAEAVVASAVTVVVGVSTLLLSLTPTTRGLGLACAVGVVIAAAFALVVLPAALVLCGRWVFWPRVPRAGQAALADTSTRWRRIGESVARRPLAYAGATTVLLVALAAGLLGVQTGLDVEDQFLDRPEAIAGADRLADSFPAGIASPTSVVTTQPPAEVVSAVESVDGVTSARVAAEGDGVAEVSLVTDAAAGSPESRSTVDALRAALDDLPDTHVVGQEAEALDEADGAARDRALIIPLILVLVLAALGILLRSVVAPVLLVATVLATYAASMGASWWIFTGPLGFGAVDAGAPLLAFLFLVCLGVDYNIFLLARAREELREHDSRTAMLRALTVTGGVITSAGVLLAAVFLVLGVLPLVVLAQLGIIVCIGVLLDTLVVRTVLVPALAFRLGDRFWWPRPAGSSR